MIIEIEKRLPVQGGLGGASGNAVAALLALERALKKRLSGPERLRIAAEVGSDLPLFLVGGTVLGVGRGEEVYPLPDLPSVPCVIATPGIAVSTPKAFADWDRMCGAGAPARGVAEQRSARTGRSRVPTRLLPLPPDMPVSSEGTAELRSARTGEGARPHTGNGPRVGNGDPDASELTAAAGSDRMLELGRRISAGLSGLSGVPVSKGRGRAETPLLDLVRTGIENDFERVVFPKYPELREVKSVLERAGALYASLSGSGSAVYGLFGSRAAAVKAASRLRKQGTPAVATATLTRPQYWEKIFD